MGSLALLLARCPARQKSEAAPQLLFLHAALLLSICQQGRECFP